MSHILPPGNSIYQETHNNLCIKGISYSNNDVDSSAQIIADICFDVSGQKDFETYIHSLSDTGFNPINFVTPTVKDWQVGEGFAEAYLTAHHSCCFPWSNNRDLKNPKSSLTGADMVGYHQGQFAFGEVKTSTEQKYPPQVTSKKSDGLNTQLNKLCQDLQLRSVLVQYLYFRQKDKTEYRQASIAYLKNHKNFYVFGVLVRDVKATINDWTYLKKYLSAHNKDKVFLVALYLPQNNGIQKLHTAVLSKEAKS